MKGKRGFEVEIQHIVIAVFVLVVLVLGVSFLLGDKGREIFEAIKNMLRFGK